jgi:uncharacterized alpha-E superfamily protein
MSSDTSRFAPVSAPAAPRPLLARDADALYWMSRYIERAEHIARILLINANLLIDVGDLSPDLQQRQWQSVLTILRPPSAAPPLAPAPAAPLREARDAGQVARHLAFDLDNPNSIAACIGRARENARGVRETISAEMWENLNTLYWQLRDAPARFDEAPDELYRTVIHASMLFQGLTDQTLEHDQRWHFTQLGKYLERIDITARVIATKYDILRSAEPRLEAPLKNIHWMSVLRSCCSIEAFRRNHIGDFDPVKVMSFLILEPDFPRSIAFCVGAAHAAIAAVRAETSPRAIDPAERALGRLKIQLEYAETAEIMKPGPIAYLQRIQADTAEAALAIQKSYFLH